MTARLPQFALLLVGVVATASLTCTGSVEPRPRVAGRAADPLWQAAPSMAYARIAPTATLLADGRVLLAGGFGAVGFLRTAERYDPQTNSWKDVALMAGPRFGHTSTLLPNGKVLLAGGSTLGNFFPETERYDPVANNWATTGPVASKRQGHAAVRLLNGTILVVGGVPPVGGPAGSAELYSATTDVWTSAAGMAQGRAAFTATLLSSGKVLVAGGAIDSNYQTTSSAELYDPGTNAWSSASPLGTDRSRHQATLLPNGKVLVTGGSKTPPGTVLSSAELYDPVSNTWTSAGSMSGARRNHTQTLLPSGRVLVAGGSDGASLASAEQYDPLSNTWLGAPAMGVARSEHTATLLPNKMVLVAGGSNIGARALASAELYDATSGMACAAATECVSGHCVDGVCCDKACPGACQACDLVGSEGVCTKLPAAAAGSPDCAPYACSGASEACPTSCGSDLACGAGYFCSGAACVLKRSTGAGCSAGNECASTHCAAGVCCGTACLESCAACNRIGSMGTCTNLPAGDVGSPTCAPYVCGGTASCPSSCTSDRDCVVGGSCFGGRCLLAKPPGAACGHATECLTGSCVDGVCCTTRCSGGCEACNILGKVGTCASLPAGAVRSERCGAYACDGLAECPTKCFSAADCSPSAYCVANSCVVGREQAPPVGSGGGPEHGGSATGCASAGGSMLVLALGGLMLFRRPRAHSRGPPFPAHQIRLRGRLLVRSSPTPRPARG